MTDPNPQKWETERARLQAKHKPASITTVIGDGGWVHALLGPDRQIFDTFPADGNEHRDDDWVRSEYGD